MIGKHYMPLVAIAASLLVLGCDKQAEAETEQAVDAGVALETVNQRFSYAFGLRIGRQFKQQDARLDVDAMTMAIKDIYSETEPKLSDEEVQIAVQTFQQEQQEKEMARQQSAADDNVKIGAEFLAVNGEKEGVVTLESGLQYKVLTAGEGARPAADATVTVHYRGRLIDGTEFDSSYSRNQPATFPVQGVIAGWTEALQLMSEGSTYELYIPSELAYGANGSPPVIGPGATLIFEVELLKAGAE